MSLVISPGLRTRFIDHARHLGRRYAAAETCYLVREIRSVRRPGANTFMALKAFHRAQRLGLRLAQACLVLRNNGLKGIAREVESEAHSQCLDARFWFLKGEQEAGRFVPRIDFAFDPNTPNPQ